MIFLYIYIGFSVLTFVMTIIQSYLVSKQLKRRYPDLVSKFNKNNKQSVLEKVFSYIKTFVSCFVPIINMGIFYVALFENNKVEEKVLNKMKEDIKEGFYDGGK